MKLGAMQSADPTNGSRDTNLILSMISGYLNCTSCYNQHHRVFAPRNLINVSIDLEQSIGVLCTVYHLTNVYAAW